MKRHTEHRQWSGLLVVLVVGVGCAGVRPGGSLSMRRYELEPVGVRMRPVKASLAVARLEPERTKQLEPERAARGKAAPEGKASGAERPREPVRRERVLEVARSLVGKSKVRLGGRAWPDDCTGFVEAVLAQAGVALRGKGQPGDNGVTTFYRHAQAHGRVYTQGIPRPGDLVFFRETYDRNRDGRRNDGLTHVGLVESVEANGTVTVIHRVQRGVARYRMNLKRPNVYRDERTGTVLNDMLRLRGRSGGPVLTGQLFAAYASVLPTAGGGQVARR